MRLGTQSDVAGLAAPMRPSVEPRSPRIMRYVEAYLMMAVRAWYRPAAPGDGCGGIYLSRAELEDPDRLRREAFEYAMGFDKEEDGCAFHVGCSNFSTNRAFIFTIEAARQLAGGSDGNATALRLLRTRYRGNQIRRPRASCRAMNSPTAELRLGLAAVGITPLPSTVTKEVFLPGWTTRAIDEQEIISWDKHRDWPNTSGRTTKHPCLDIDILDAEVAGAVEQLVRTRFDGRGTTLLRTGRAPKRLIPFCTDTPFAKRVLCYTAPNGAPHRIEFLGAGQQAVFYGMHESGKPYYWHADRDPLKVPPCEWVKITEVEADQLLVEIDELLVEQFNYTRVTAPGPGGTARSTGRVTDVDEALREPALRRRGRWRKYPRHRARVHQYPHRSGQLHRSCGRRGAAAVGIYAAGNPLCARWDLEKERRRLEAMAYSFINKFPDYADRLPPDLYSMRQTRRGRGVLDPQLVYDRARKLWHYPEPEQSADEGTAGDTGGSREGARKRRGSSVSSRSASYAPATIPGISSTNLSRCAASS